MSKAYVDDIWWQLILNSNETNGTYEPFLDENNLKSCPNEKLNMLIIVW
jgi:hypothetical protein